MNTDQDIAELKECQRRLEAKLKDLIERSPALRKAMERVYDEAGNVIETHEHAGQFKDW
jgi:hypothetical protein